MGRWAQRRRGGGQGTVTRYIVFASISGTDTAIVQYSSPFDATELTASEFASTPSGATGTIIAQIGPSSIEITFDDTISTDTTLSWTGTTPGFAQGQSKAYDV